MNDFDPDFGDDDPEDGFDASDTIKQRVTNLVLRVRWIYERLPDSVQSDIRDRLQRLQEDLKIIRDELVDD